MSTFKVTAEKLVILPHPNADALELAQVGLYRAVVPKGVYQTGDYALYIPEQAVLPETLIEELGLTGRLAGKQKNRVKAIRLRGELSQGIVCKIPQSLRDWCFSKKEQEHQRRRETWPEIEQRTLSSWSIIEEDLAPALNITKYVPEIPVHMAGEVIDGSELLDWVDIENIKRNPDVFTPGEVVVITEKIHGTCCIMTYIPAEREDTEGVVLVSSKGLADKHLALAPNDDNLYWRAVIGNMLPVFASRIAEIFNGWKVALYGEVYGAGVQDLTYGGSAKNSVPGYALFDIRIEFPDGERRWLDSHEVTGLVAAFALDLPIQCVPTLYTGPFDMDKVWELASGPETVSGSSTHIREGVVIRPASERRSEALGGRAILKAVSEDYLLRKNGTEYE